MKLQAAFDFHFTSKRAEELAKCIEAYIDVIEVGTPFIMEEGLGAVKRLKEKFPKKQILADLKIVDAGSYEADAAFQMGADIVTVLAAADNATIQNVQQAARACKKEVLVDMLSVSCLPERIREIDAMGADYICLHTSKDLQKIDTDAAQAFRTLKNLVSRAKLALAGGICCGNIEKYAAIRPDLIIVGEGISGEADPGRAAASIKEKMQQYEQEGIRC